MPKRICYKEFDREIEIGHVYVNLAIALSLEKNPLQASEISKTMDELVQSCGYLREVLESYGPLNRVRALGVLANRASRDSILVLNRNLQVQSEPGMSYSLGEISVPVGA